MCKPAFQIAYVKTYLITIIIVIIIIPNYPMLFEIRLNSVA
jgi:hypothetical protein